MIRTLFKLLVCILAYTIVSMAAGALMPYSQGFKELGAPENSLTLLFVLVNNAWVCFTMYFIIRHAHCNGKKLLFNIIFVMFFVQSFMTQIETLLFGGAFPVLTKPDIMLIMLSNLFPLLAAAPLLIRFFQNKDTAEDKKEIRKKSLLIKLGTIGIVYVFVYYLFGYFVAWQFEGVQQFYAGTLTDTETNYLILIPFQILRGILFGVFILPLKDMIGKKTAFIASVCLVYLCTAIMLVIPNALFPDRVRIAHLIEMSTSMLLFGIIAGNILWAGKSGSPAPLHPDLPAMGPDHAARAEGADGAAEVLSVEYQ